jgi:Fic family protein
VSYFPFYTITPLLLSKVEKVAALRERILAAAVQVPWIPALQKDTRIRNAHSSTAIEGNPLTLEQVRAIEEGREIPATAQRARREVANYFAGLRFVEKNARAATITHAQVLKLHRIMAGNVMDQGKAGEYRDIRVKVGNYIAPRPEEVKPMMSDLIEWWNKQAGKISPILSSAIVHHQFEIIHPFADGNGRAGRTLSLWELYRRGLTTTTFFPSTSFIGRIGRGTMPLWKTCARKKAISPAGLNTARKDCG